MRVYVLCIFCRTPIVEACEWLQMLRMSSNAAIACEWVQMPANVFKCLQLSVQACDITVKRSQNAVYVVPGLCLIDPFYFCYSI